MFYEASWVLSGRRGCHAWPLLKLGSFNFTTVILKSRRIYEPQVPVAAKCISLPSVMVAELQIISPCHGGWVTNHITLPSVMVAELQIIYPCPLLWWLSYKSYLPALCYGGWVTNHISLPSVMVAELQIISPCPLLWWLSYKSYIPTLCYGGWVTNHISLPSVMVAELQIIYPCPLLWWLSYKSYLPALCYGGWVTNHISLPYVKDDIASHWKDMRSGISFLSFCFPHCLSSNAFSTRLRLKFPCSLPYIPM